MDRVKIGVIGMGGMGYAHSKSIESLEETELTCVCDVEGEVVREKADEFGVKYFTDYRELVKSGLCDAVIVATPHWFHPEISVFAMEHGLHVLSEKPIAVTVSGADAMIKVAKKNRRVFAVMYQMRTLPVIKKAVEIIKDGLLGEIKRTLFIDPWYRAQAYYESASWRATWAGEGGGVMMNQAPHGVDVFTLLGGLPEKVEAKMRTRLHNIEVEDEAHAVLEYPNGAWGYYYITTCEAGGTSYLELAGDKGKLILRDKELTLHTFSQSLSEFTFKAENMWASLEVKEEKIEIPSNIETGHGVIIKNFARAILYNEQLMTPGEEGLKSVEFINAVILSAKKGKPVKIPINRKEFDALMEELKKTSKPKKSAKDQRVTDPKFGNYSISQKYSHDY